MVQKSNTMTSLTASHDEFMVTAQKAWDLFALSDKLSPDSFIFTQVGNKATVRHLPNALCNQASNHDAKGCRWYLSGEPEQ